MMFPAPLLQVARKHIIGEVKGTEQDPVTLRGKILYLTGSISPIRLMGWQQLKEEKYRNKKLKAYVKKGRMSPLM